MTQELHFDTTLELQGIYDEDLRLIQQFGDKNTTMENYAAITLTAITDKVVYKEGLRLIVSREFQEKHVKDFIGKPLMEDHSSEKRLKRGRIYKSEVLTAEDGTTYTEIRAFIPKVESNQDAIDRIRLGQDLECSLGFRFSNYEEIEIDGIPHVRILPSDSPGDGPTEVSLVGQAACPYPDCGVTAIAASADQPLKSILIDKHLSPMDRECLLFGRMMKENMVGDVVSYERQLGLVTDVKLAKASYENMSPFTLQDRRESLLKTLKRNEKADTQCSVDAEALLSAEFREEEIPESIEAQRSRLDTIVQQLKEKRT